MGQDLHLALRQTVRDHVAGRTTGTPAGPVFDAGEVVNALVNVLAEVIVSGHPETRFTLLAAVHSALDETVVEKGEASKVPYPEQSI